MTITNKGQFCSLFNRSMVTTPSGNSPTFGTIKPNMPYIYRKPHNFKHWRYNQGSYSVYTKYGCCIDYDRKRKQISDVEKEQWRLYRQLKHEYEQEQKQAKQKQAEKLANATRKKSVQLLQGLANSPRYDRIYA